MSNYLNRRNNNNLDLFEEEPFFTSFFNNFQNESNKLLSTDIKETDKEYVILIDVPGFEKKDIKISLDEGYLTVSATNHKDNKNENEKYLRCERFYGTCSRSYYIGDIKQEEIKANVENGVLKIFIPKNNFRKKEERSFIQID